MKLFDIFIKFGFPWNSELDDPPTVQDCALRAFAVLESKPDDYEIGKDSGYYLTLVFHNREFASRFEALSWATRIEQTILPEIVGSLNPKRAEIDVRDAEPSKGQ